MSGVTTTKPRQYPAQQPFDERTMKVSDIHTIRYWQAGNPKGKPVIFLHGGPGGGTTPTDTTYFDPEVYRVVLVDQRGAGKSEPTAELRENTTWDLVSDIEKIREELGIEKWLVFGGSWSELEWFYQDGGSHIWPEAWANYLKPIPENERGDLISAYHKQLTCDDEAKSLTAAKAWSTWEESCSKLFQDPRLVELADMDAKWARAFARIECHYFVNGGFFEDGFLIKKEQIDKIRHLPTFIVQGRYDCVCPARSAYDLKQAFPEAELKMVDDAGHSAREPGITKLLVEAADRFGKEVQW